MPLRQSSRAWKPPWISAAVGRFVSIGPLRRTRVRRSRNEIYQARGSDTFDFSTPDHATLAQSLTIVGLVNGDLYRFIVRARDVWGNEDANAMTHGAIPTTPVDNTPPIFAGLTSARDARSGGSVDLSWSPASDPDTTTSNSDPSLPIRYLVYAAPKG